MLALVVFTVNTPSARSVQVAYTEELEDYQKYGVSQEFQAVMDRIAMCESKNHALAKNPNSSASGRFQFIKSSWEYYGNQLWGTTTGKSVFDWEHNTELAYYVAKKNKGFTDWFPSFDCWK